MDIEEADLIISSLLSDEEYTRKTLPFLKKEYFTDNTHKILFELISSFYEKYGKSPTKESILIEAQNLEGITEESYKNVVEYLSNHQYEKQDLSYLIDLTEQYCRNRAVYNAIMDSIAIYDGTKDEPITAIPDKLSSALSVAFDDSIGHDFLNDAEKRWEFYHVTGKRYEFDLKMLNEITKTGRKIGVPSKSFCVVMGTTGGGKSAFLTNLAAGWLTKGYNVVYITLEMAEERIAERVDANLLNMNLDDVQELPKPKYLKMVEKVKEKCLGKLIIKEYPTAAAHAGHFRYLLKELQLKKKFKPDIVIVDYINICASSRIKNQNANSYTIVKSIAEELRGLAVEFDCCLWTATQVGRGGSGVSDVDLTDVSESWGLPATADLFLALISTEEMMERDEIMVKQLKNRFGDIGRHNKFMLGFNRAKMQFYDLNVPSLNSTEAVKPEKKSSTQEKLEKKDKFKEFKF